MAKTMIVTDASGKKYTLEFTRKTVSLMERQGFTLDDMGKKPMTTWPALFAGAFRANHPTVSNDKIEKIYDTLHNKTDLIGKLMEMYNEPLEALMADPEEAAEGNGTWVAGW